MSALSDVERRILDACAKREWESVVHRVGGGWVTIGGGLISFGVRP